MYLEDGAKDYLIKNLTTYDAPYDLCMIFITQDNIRSDELFKYKYFTTDTYYYNVFNFMFNYTIDKLKKDRFKDVIRDIIPKLDCDYYTHTYNKKLFIDPNFIVSKYLEDVLLYIMKNMESYDVINFIHIIHSNTNIDPSVVQNILLRNKEFHDFNIMKYMITEGLFTLEFIMLMLEELNKYYDKGMIAELISYVYYNKDKLLDILFYTMDKYDIYNDKNKWHIKLNKFKVTTKNGRDFYTFLRRHLIKIFDGELESDVFEFVNEPYAIYMSNGNKVYSEIFKKFLFWLSSRDRTKSKCENYIKYGVEEGWNLYTENELHLIQDNLFVISYLNEINKLDPFRLFLRVINLSRFLFFQFGNRNSIIVRLNMLIETYGYYIENANNMYLYLFLYL